MNVIEVFFMCFYEIEKGGICAMAHENLWSEMKAHSMKSRLLYLKVTIGDFLDIGNVAKFEQQMWDLFYSLLTPESASKIRGINQ